MLAHDYGDTVAQELLARRANERALPLRSICFLNGGLFPETHRPRAIQKLLASPLGPVVSRLVTAQLVRRSFVAIFGRGRRPTAAELDAFWRLTAESDGDRGCCHRLIRYMAERRAHRDRWVGALQRTRIPLLLIDGALDPVSGAHMVARYRELVPDPDVVLLPDVGHYPQVEAPEQVLAAFGTFVDTRRP